VVLSEERRKAKGAKESKREWSVIREEGVVVGAEAPQRTDH
jgi:hypothetical protein